MSSRTPSFDTQAFYAEVDRIRRLQRLTWRKVAKAAKVNPSTLTTLALNGSIGLESVIKLLIWIGNTDLHPYIVKETGDE